MRTRRRFLKNSAALAGAALAPSFLLPMGGCASAQLPDAADNVGDEVLLGLYRSSDLEREEQAIEQMMARIDLGWLNSGDSIFIKVASNSPFAHPAVTSPTSVRAVVAALFAAGAGRVLVGDQAGVEYVRLARGEQRRSATSDIMERNGLLAAITDSGAEPHFFDDQGYADGYFAATPPPETHWDIPIMLPNIIRDVDHLVYLPRIASHALAGYTHGHKIAIGWLRDDCRKYLHTKGRHFHKNFVDVNYCEEIRSRLRLVLTYADQFMLDGGPDRGTIAPADPRVVVASADLAHHDAVSAALLSHFDNVVADTGSGIDYGFYADLTNFFFLTSVVENSTNIPFGSAWGYTPLVPHRYWKGLSKDRALRRAYEIRGQAPRAISVMLDGTPPDAGLASAMQAYSDGLLQT